MPVSAFQLECDCYVHQPRPNQNLVLYALGNNKDIPSVSGEYSEDDASQTLSSFDSHVTPCKFH